MKPTFFEYMDEEQQRKFNEAQGKRRLLGLLKEKVRSPLRWLAWRLWGRRRAIKRMRELALSGTSYWQRPRVEDEESRLASHRDHLDALKVPLPTPDSHDVN